MDYNKVSRHVNNAFYAKAISYFPHCYLGPHVCEKEREGAWEFVNEEG